MPITRRTSILPRLYAWAESTGILDHDVVYAAFVRSYFLYKRYVEDPFVGLAARHPALFRRGHILDIGANVGYTATVFRRAAVVPYRVFAFEPDERNVRALRRAAAPYSADAIVVVPEAVGERAGWVDFWHNRAHAGDHRIVTAAFGDVLRDRSTVRRVRMTTVDDYVAQQSIATAIGFIKVDVQGYELAVCRGMARTLDANPEASVAIEYAPAGSRILGFDPHAVETFFREREYRIYTIGRDGALHAFDDRLRDSIQDDAYVDLLCTRTLV